MDEKQQALTALRAEFERWETLLASLSEAQISAPLLADGWSIKDVIAHLWTWQQRSVARMDAALHNRQPEYPAWPAALDPEMEGEPNELNNWLYEAARDRPWPSVRQDWREGFLRLLELAEALPAAALLEVGRYPWLEGYALLAVLHGSYEHHHEHAENLEPLLARVRQYSV